MERMKFSAKNGNSSSRSVVVKCKVASAREKDGKTLVTLDCNCKDPKDDSGKFHQVVIDGKLVDLDGQDTIDVPAIHSAVTRLAETRKSNRGMRRLAPPRVAADGPRTPRWISLINGITTYQFNVFVMDASLDQQMIQSIFDAQQKDLDLNSVRDYGRTATFNVYKADALGRADLFQGDAVSIFIGKYSQGAFHYVNSQGSANAHAFPVAGGDLAGYGIQLPSGSNYDFVPYSLISSDDMNKYYGSPSNIYAISPTTVPQNTYYQVMSMAINHEIKEIISNDSTLNWVLFDFYAPTVANWHWAEFTSPTNRYLCTNSSPTSGGFVGLPTFKQKFPKGGLLFAVKEVGDVVSTGMAGLLNSYKVGDWLMSNYPTENFWQPYLANTQIKYDKLGFVALPMEPYGGLHELVIFTSLDDGKTRLLSVTNRGPVTAAMLGVHPSTNFPPDYVYVQVVSMVTAGMDVHDLINSVDNYSSDVMPM